ncbi:NAD(P)-binding protein [Azospirillum sp. BE72]|uniref:NAD(P)-binding protein n=1 Tax=Azospirillum sp. BE72 TaxID=2817776 RepID=UPI0038D49A93
MTAPTEPGVVIVGAGPAGIRAAETLAAAGLRPTVIDEGARAGGQIHRRPPDGFTRPPAPSPGRPNRCVPCPTPPSCAVARGSPRVRCVKRRPMAGRRSTG